VSFHLTADRRTSTGCSFGAASLCSFVSLSSLPAALAPEIDGISIPLLSYRNANNYSIIMFPLLTRLQKQSYYTLVLMLEMQLCVRKAQMLLAFLLSQTIT